MAITTLTLERPSLWRQYLELCKPKVVLLIVFTSLVGMILSSPTLISLELIFFANLGIGMAAASGAPIKISNCRRGASSSRNVTTGVFEIRSIRTPRTERDFIFTSVPLTERYRASTMSYAILHQVP